MKKLIYLAILLIFISCNKKYGQTPEKIPSTEYNTPMHSPHDEDQTNLWTTSPNDDNNLPTNTPPEEEQNISYSDTNITTRKIAKTANIDITAKKYTQEKQRIKNLLKKFNALIIKEEETQDYSKYLKLEIKVPAQLFDTLITEICNTKESITYKQIELQDITAQYIDTEIRLKNKKATEAQYLNILKKANTIQDVLEVTEYLQKIREEIESMEGLINYYNNQVKYSYIYLTISKNKPYIENKKFDFANTLKNNIIEGWHLFLYFIILLLSLTPFWILAAIIIFVAKKYKKKKNAKS